MLRRKDDLKPFEKKVYLASPTMHGEELKYMQEAYETNWMSTVGENINEVERIAAEKADVKYAVALCNCTSALHLCVKFAGERLYGKPMISHGALEGKRVFCSDMTFDATLNPVVYEGGIPVFIDTEESSWNMDPVALDTLFLAKGKYFFNLMLSQDDGEGNVVVLDFIARACSIDITEQDYRNDKINRWNAVAFGYIHYPELEVIE